MAASNNLAQDTFNLTNVDDFPNIYNSIKNKPGEYVITLPSGGTMNDPKFGFNAHGVKITIKGDSENPFELKKTGPDALFWVSDGVIVLENIKLTSTYKAPDIYTGVVIVGTGENGMLEIGNGVIISEDVEDSAINHNGVWLNGGSFIMSEGSKITRCRVGVGTNRPSLISITGGEIYGNTGNGVWVTGANSSFKKTGGTIYGTLENTSDSSKANKDSAIYVRASDSSSFGFYRDMDDTAGVFKVKIDGTGNGFEYKIGNW